MAEAPEKTFPFRDVDPRSIPLVIVHGFLSPPAGNLPLHRRFRREGLRTYNVPIPGLNTQDMRRSSKQVAETVERVMTRNGAPCVNLMGVSMGGLIAVHYVRCRDGASCVRRTVTLASPFQGTGVASVGHAVTAKASKAAAQMTPGSDFLTELNADPLPPSDIVSIGVVGDALVSPDAARLRGARNVVSPHGRWPIAHYDVILMPKNYRLYRDLLLAP